MISITKRNYLIYGLKVGIVYLILLKVFLKHTQKIVYIINESHPFIESINRQLCHYSYHIGQIIYLGKFILEENWESLSIPKGHGEDVKIVIRIFCSDKKRMNITTSVKVEFQTGRVLTIKIQLVIINQIVIRKPNTKRCIKGD